MEDAAEKAQKIVEASKALDAEAWRFRGRGVSKGLYYLYVHFFFLGGGGEFASLRFKATTEEVKSYYWWEGKVNFDPEWRVAIKTSAPRQRLKRFRV